MPSRQSSFCSVSRQGCGSGQLRGSERSQGHVDCNFRVMRAVAHSRERIPTYAFQRSAAMFHDQSDQFAHATELSTSFHLHHQP